MSETEQEFDEVGRVYCFCPDLDTRALLGTYTLGTEGVDAETRYPSTKAKANLISSLCQDGLHRPVLDIDLPAAVEAVEGQRLVRFGRDMLTGEYEYFRREMKKLGFDTSSLRGEHLHRGALHIDAPFKLVPSTTQGHFHLYIDAPLLWEEYRAFLDVLGEVKLLESGYVGSAIRRGQTFVRPEWVQKPTKA